MKSYDILLSHKRKKTAVIGRLCQIPEIFSLLCCLSITELRRSSFSIHSYSHHRVPLSEKQIAEWQY